MSDRAVWKPTLARTLCAALAGYAAVTAFSFTQPSAFLDAFTRVALAWAERARRTPTPSWRAAPRPAQARGGGKVATAEAKLDVRAHYSLGTRSPVVRVLELPDGAVVAATFDEGLFRLEPGQEQFVRWGTGVDARINDLAAAPDGAVYVATAAGAYRLNPDAVHPTQLDEGAFTAATWWNGHAYFASRRGVSRVEGDGLWTRGAAHGLPADQPASLAACGAVLCVGAVDGLWLYDGTRAEHASSASDALPEDWVTAASFRGDTLWAGTLDGGLARRDRTGWRRFAPEDGLPDGRVQSHALVARPGGAVFATPSGLWALSRDTAVALRPDAPLDEPSALAPAQPDGFWVGGRGTVTRAGFSEEELP
jgi:ligand-binding sensor domain-containing protein